MKHRSRHLGHAIALGVCAIIGAGSAIAAPANKPATPAVPLTEAGAKLEAQYATALKDLQAAIAKAVPAVDEQKKAAYQKAREAELAAEAELAKRQAALGACQGTAGLLEHRKGWVSRAIVAVAAAEEAVKQAATDDARTAAQAALEKEQKNKTLGEEELKKSEAAVEQAKAEEPKLTEELKAAEAALAKAQAETLQAVNDLGLNAVLASDKLDAQLAKCMVLSRGTPRGLAGFAQQGGEQAALVEKLLADDTLMKQMVAADGAKDGRYGEAMQIYTAIQQASPKAGEGLFQRLALGVSLEHAVPVKQSSPAAVTNAPATVDPVKRYLHFEKAYLAGELDPGFKGLTAWDYRMVVYGDEPDEILAWGREMLRNYRPDHIATADYRWRYVKAVKTEVKYGSGDAKNDIPTMHGFQNMINTGGVCGRRAFFGRFILRCFGVPVVARPQPGHAALAHWTPDGWVINLGAGWGCGSTSFGKDLDFLAVTQARNAGDAYLAVQRAQWVGEALGEPRAYGFNDKEGLSSIWNVVALYRQRAIIEEAKAVALAAVGTDIGEANESKVKDAIEAVAVTDADRQITVGGDGTITVPAVACSSPTGSTEKVVFMKSYLGGLQLHHARLGKPEAIEYTLDVPQEGSYALSARVVTVSPNQQFLVTANGAAEPVSLALPYTVGKWETTQPVAIPLAKGKNVLRFTRGDDVKGVSIKEFTLMPVK